MTDRRGGLRRRTTHARTNSGTESSPSRTPGATASPPCRSRTRAAVAGALLPGQRDRERVLEAIAARQRPHPADARDRHRQDRDRLPDRLEAVPEPLELADWKRGEPTRRPRILFLADRNILADQAYNAFSAFPEDALVRIEPDEIRKKGRVPKNGSVFFTIFQTFMSGRDADGEARALFRRLSARFLRLHHHRRVPSRRRERRKQLARHPRIFRAGRAARSDRDAEAAQTTSIPTPISASRFTSIR